jgi:hypothetical protein
VCGKLKLFGSDKSKVKGNEDEKPIVLYYAKYIGVLGSNKSLPLEEDAYVYIFQDRIVIEHLKSKVNTKIPYESITDLQHIDAGKKVDLDRVFGLGVAGLLWRKRAIVTAIKYTDENREPQTVALDFIHNTKYAQPLINRKFREVHPTPNMETNQGVQSIADELSKLARLQDQGIITEEEFSKMKSNLIGKM